MNDQRSAQSLPPVRLLNGDFLLLLQARFVSNLGQQATQIAMIYWVMQATGSATRMGIVAMLGALPGILLSPLGGFLADRYSRRRIMVANDLVRACLLLALPALLWSGVDTGSVMVYVYVVAFAMAASGALFAPASGALMPQLVPKSTLGRANSLTQGSNALTSLMGQGLGGVLYRLLGPATLFLLDAVTYLLSAASILLIREPVRSGGEGAVHALAAPRSLVQDFIADSREGFRYCWRETGLRKILLAALVVNFFVSPLFVLLPLLVDRTYHLAADWFGYFIALTIVGGLIGMGITGVLNPGGRARWIAAVIAISLAAAALFSIGFAPPLPAAATLFLIVGAGTSVMNILLIARIQGAVPATILGRVMATMNVLSGAVVPIAMFLAGVVADLLAQNVLPVFMVSGVATGAFSLWLVIDRDIRGYLGEEG